MHLYKLALCVVPGIAACLVPHVVLAESPTKGGGSRVITPSVTYTPIRPVSSPKAPMPPPAPVANEPKAPPAARSIPSPTPVVPDDTIAVATSARAPSTRYRKILGIGSDVGVPDGVNVVLSADPFSWLRLSVAGGTNTSALGGRFGLSVIPMGFGPSFNMEAGKYQVTEPNEVIRTFFNVPKWVEPYVQQIGYTYYNAQLGYDYRFGDFIFCLHAGYSYIEGLVRSPKSVVVDSQTGSTVRMKDDGVVQAFTWSAKLGLLYQFAGV